jgi:GT2 family glycosyltransferase
VPRLSIVIPHWPLDEETDEALRLCVASFPPECERIVVVNDGTGYGRNVNIGLRLASGDFCAVVNNDCRVEGGDVSDLCVPDTVTSPLVIGERQGFGESIEPGAFHGSFWVVPREVLDRIGLLDERFAGAYWEDDDFITRLHEAGIPTRQVPSVRVRHVGGLTTVKLPEHRQWLEENARRFEEKWGWLPPPIARYRRAHGSDTWHFCQNCSQWPTSGFEETAPAASPTAPQHAGECEECKSLRDRNECAFY